MRVSRGLLGFQTIVYLWIGMLQSAAAPSTQAAATGPSAAGPSGRSEIACPQRPALERFQSYQVKPGETLAQVAQKMGLLSATLMGANPAARSGQVFAGQILKVPPYNGILVSIGQGQTLKSVAMRYKVRPDVLFEVNGCQETPKTVFVPGINWAPGQGTGTTLPGASQTALRQDRYPLPRRAEVSRFYGWQAQEKVIFSSGVNLAAAPKTEVLAVATGTVAFAGSQKPWENMVVLNHPQGRQTRYGYLGVLKVKLGQTVQRGQVLGLTAPTAAALRFELRYRSNLGWVAQDPLPYLQSIAPRSAQSPLPSGKSSPKNLYAPLSK